MALPSYPNTITLAALQTEFGGANPAALSEYYAGGLYIPAGTLGAFLGVSTAIPTSGAISLSHFHGASAFTVSVAVIFGNGSAGATTGLKFLQVFNMNTDTNVATSATQAQERNRGLSFSGNGRGYLTGGSNNTGTEISELDGYVFSTNTAINPAAYQSRASTIGVNSVNSTTAGYLTWQAVTNVGAMESSYDKFLFSTETFTSPGGYLYEGQSNTAGLSFAAAGYILGGTKPAGKTNTLLSLMTSLSFTTDAIASVSATYPSPPSPVYGSYNNTTTGYLYTSGLGLNYIKFDLATLTTAVISVGSNAGTFTPSAYSTSNTMNAGYMFGGSNASVVSYGSSIVKVNFSDNVHNNLSVVLATASAASVAAQIGSL